MKVGKLLTIGESIGVVIPRQYLRELGWLKGDRLAQAIRGKELVIRNVEAHTVSTSHQRRQFGDSTASGGSNRGRI